jgi:hypothetical protein
VGITGTDSGAVKPSGMTVNTNTLAKLYDRLSPRERLPLILAASLRGDEPEKERLARTAPRALYRLPDYHGLSEGLLLTAMLHVVQTLSLGVWFWRASTALAEAGFDKSKRGRGQERRRGDALRLAGYLITVEVDGWALFCERLRIEPNGLLRDLPDWGQLKAIEGEARPVAFTAGEAAAWAQVKGTEQTRLKTVESVAADFEQALAGWAKQWE